MKLKLKLACYQTIEHKAGSILVLLLLKLVTSIISRPLTETFHQSILKSMHKAGDDTLPEHYLPISLLSIYNRLVAKLSYRRLIKFADKNHTLYDLQEGFRNIHSTQHAIVDLQVLYILMWTKENTHVEFL